MPRPNTGPRLKPHKDTGILYITWTESGRSKRLSTGTANLSEAQKVLAGYLLELEKAQEGPRKTVGEVCEYYDKNHIETDVVDKGRQRKALAHIKRILGEDTYMDELAADDITRYRTERSKEKWHGRQINRATIRRELNTFVAAANFSVDNRKLENRHVPMVDLPEGNPNKDRYLEKKEAQDLLTKAQPSEETRLTRVYRFTAIALAAGRRKEAIEKLKWFKVDLKNRTIDFRKPGEPETKKRRGIAPISDWLYPILMRAYEEKTSEYVLDRPGSITREFRRLADAAGMPDVTPHTCRHTWGTWAAQQGESMWNVAAVLGCTVQTATTNYLHHSPGHLRNVANRVSPELGSNVTPLKAVQGGKDHAS